MAQLYVVSVLDRALDAYMRPFYTPAIGAAVRSFNDEMNRKDSEMAKHPEDYDLFHLAMFDEETGKFTPLDEPKQIAIGKQQITPTH